MAATLQIRLFGGLGVALDNVPIKNFYSIKSPALVAYLAVTRRAPTRDALAALFWGEMSDADARTNLRQCLANLRKLLEPYLLITRDTVEFNFDAPYVLDLEQFETKLHAGNLSEAVALYQGDFLDGVFVREAPEFEEWSIGQRARLRELSLQALHTLTQQHAARGEHARGIDYAMRLLALDPWREETHRELMRMLARSGQRSVALQQYNACKRVLVEGMGVEPSAETTALYERIRAAGESPRHNLPRQSTSFVGRTTELAQIDSLLLKRECRLITLIGAGGIGKTRLALQAAERALKIGSFLNGVFFVPVGSVASADSLTAAIADACGLTFSGEQGPQAQLVNYLREKELLLVLDSLEHLPTASDWVSEILSRTPNVKILLTSRERLNLQLEWLVAVDGLDYPRGAEAADVQRFSAVSLFVERARQARADFELSADAQPSVARVCQLVEGMPLGIELAAAWLQTHTCDEIAREIEQGYAFLTTSARDVPEHHRSLRAMFDLAWSRLSAQEQKGFQRLAVFSGGFQREAAECVTGASLAQVSGLVEKSLLRRNAPIGDTPPRYEMHELLRQYAAEKLAQAPDEQAQARRHHSNYFADYAHQRNARLKGQDPRKALAEIRPEIENLRAAWHQAVGPGKPPAVSEIDRAMEALLMYWDMQAGFGEGESAFAQAVAAFRDRASAPDSLDARSRIVYANLLADQGWFCFRLARYEKGHDLIEAGLAILQRLGAWEETGYPLLFAGACAFGMGRLADSKRLFMESRAVYERTRDAWGIAGALNNLGQVAVAMGEHEQASQFIKASLVTSRTANIRYLQGHALNNLGGLQFARGEYASARQTLQECLSIAEELEDHYLIAQALGNLGAAALALDEPAEAEERYQQALRIAVDIGDRWSWAGTLNGLGDAAFKLKSLAEARGYFRRALEIAWEIGAASVALNSVQGISRVLAGEGEAERALELSAFTLSQFDSEQTSKDAAQRLVAELTTELPAEQARAAEERGRALRLGDAVAQVLKI